MKRNNIDGSIVADGDISNVVNAQNSHVNQNAEIINHAKKVSFWVSLITGTISSLVASFIFYCLTSR